MSYSAAKLESVAIRIILSEMKGWGEPSERMARMQEGQMKAKRQRHISVLLVCNRDYFPFAQIIAGEKQASRVELVPLKMNQVINHQHEYP